MWSRLGNPDNYVEAFAGSLAVMLLRPDPPKIETINDLDCMVANFWRATQRDHEAVAAHADGPVNEADLHARHRWLVLSDDAAAFRQAMRSDPDYYDAKVAGWWCWGLCCWIGSGWCDASKIEGSTGPQNGPPGGSGERNVKISKANGIHAAGGIAPDKRPAIGGADNHKLGVGVDAWGPSHFREGRPQLADAYDIGRGVNASAPEEFVSDRLPQISGPGQGTKYGDGVCAKGDAPWDGSVGPCAARRAWLIGWFSRLRDRLRLVRVCCGHWSRVCSSESVTTRLGVTGVFLDPPYPAHQNGKKSRAGKLYATDGTSKSLDDLRDEVLAWCVANGSHPMMRIVVAGYEGDGYEVLVRHHGWKEESWVASGGYGNRTAEGKANAARERLWLSPGCLTERTLFDGLTEEDTHAD